MEFTKYMHLERFGTSEVEGIEVGESLVFPKLDGTNASVWMNDDGEVIAGSRNRDLSQGKDNAGFYAWVKEQSNIKQYLHRNPTHTLYGEWLVPHSLKTYEDAAWRNFYVFDVVCDGEYIPYDDYKDGLHRHGIEYIAPIAVVKNGNEEVFQKCLDKNTYLIKDGEGVGEGIVIKNYGYTNKYGRTVWAKIVTNSFKAVHGKAMGCPTVGQQIVEEKIVDKYVTIHLVEKVHAKIVNECEGWQSKFIPRLLHTVFHDLVTEEIWNALKDFKNPKVDFGTLMRLSNAKVKDLMPSLF